MQKIIKQGKNPPVLFTCDNCDSQFESDEYKKDKVGTYDQGKYVESINLVDKCPNCRKKVHKLDD